MATVHVMPTRDLVAHSPDETCVCGPLVDPVLDGDDRVAGFIAVHAVLDASKSPDRQVRTEVAD